MLISYAQNFEDVMLWRALGHVLGGFYIDAGAASPNDDSVTRLFYERGWRGINIEPNETFFLQLKEQRSRDINLQVGLADFNNDAVLFEIVGTGLSTFLPEVAQEHAERGYCAVQKKIQITTLEAVWDQYAPDAVHFLKIDVEGMEASLLRGNNWQKNRPWIILVESTRPMTQIETHHEWESILLASNYLFVYFDGLNRFYVAEEHAALTAKFNCPPNVFDRFKTVALAKAEADCQLAQALLKRAEADILACRERNSALQATIDKNFLLRKPKILRNSR